MESSKTQLSIPFDIQKQDLTGEFAEIVKQNWQITFSKQYMTSLYAKRVMGMIAAQVKQDGDIKDYYQFTAADIIKNTEKGLDKNEVYKRMRTLIYELAEVIYFVENKEEQTFIPYHLLNTSYKKPAGYYNGKITIVLNPNLAPLIKELAHYSKYELREYMNFGSWYSMRLYEILSAYKDKQYVEFDIERYRNWMGCGLDVSSRTGRVKTKNGKPKYIKYQNHGDAVKRTTREPLKDLKDTDLEFTFSIIYDKSGRGRPAIKGLRFVFVNPRKDTNQLLNELMRKNEKFKRAFDLMQNWKVSRENFAKYAELIGVERIFKLNHEWLSRKNTPKEITSPLKFCNKVFSTLGKELLEQKFGEEKRVEKNE